MRSAAPCRGHHTNRAPIVGILLAAGSSSRFGADKLAASLPDGALVGVTALKNLASAVDSVIAGLRRVADYLVVGIAVTDDGRRPAESLDEVVDACAQVVVRKLEILRLVEVVIAHVERKTGIAARNE